MHADLTTAVMLSGGGMDSLVLARYLVALGIEVHALVIDYGQVTADKQLEATEAWAQAEWARGRIKVVPISCRDLYRVLLGDYADGVAQLSGAKPRPRTRQELSEHTDESGAYSAEDAFGWIHGRNGMMLYMAAVYAGARKFYRVYTGFQSEMAELVQWRWKSDVVVDDMWFPFFESINRHLQTSIGVPMEVLTPFMHLSKLEVTRLGLGLGLKLEDFTQYTYSCEHVPVCGVCEQCGMKRDVLDALIG